jgi:hypothetical protein
VNRPSLRSLAVALSLALVVPLQAMAQTPKTKSPPRLPPNASEQSHIPAGVDTGSPVTGDSLPLGTPVPPNASAGRTELTTRSAAARAAARPKPVASSADCTRKIAAPAGDAGKPGIVAVPKVGLTGRPPTPTPPASGATRIDCN